MPSKSHTLRNYSSWWDRQIGRFWPNKQYTNAHFRRMGKDLQYEEDMLLGLRVMGYRDAASGGRNTPWRGNLGDADSQIVNNLPNMMKRQRELNRDDPIASGLSNTFVDDVIGDGMRAQARTSDNEKNARIEAVWKERMDLLHPVEGLAQGAGQRLVFRKALEDGGIFTKKTKRDDDDPIWLETIEKDRVATPIGQKAVDPKGKIVDGVEKDANDWPVAYWVADRSGIAFGVPPLANKFTRVEADFVNHLKHGVNRPGQTHGVPKFHAILQDLRDMDLLLVAALKRTQVAAMLAAFITSEVDTPDIADLTAKRYGYELDQPIEPGMFVKLNPGEEITTLIPNFPTPEFEPFIVMLARRIGAALGVTWQIVLKDFSKANYSSARTDLLEARKVYTVLQTWFIKHHLNWVWTSVLEDARLRGDSRLAGVTSEDISKVHWITNGWRWVDPVKEANATKISMSLGLTTLRDEAAAQGKDWQELLEQQKLEMETRETLGLPDPFAAKTGTSPFATSRTIGQPLKPKGANGGTAGGRLKGLTEAKRE